MKKVIAVVLAIIMVFSLAACGGEKKAEKYCWNCGEGITKDAAFCEYCGAAANIAQPENEDVSSDNQFSDTDTSSDYKPSTNNNTSSSYKPSTNNNTSSSYKPSTNSSSTNNSTHTHSYRNATCTSPAKR